MNFGNNYHNSTSKGVPFLRSRMKLIIALWNLLIIHLTWLVDTRLICQKPPHMISKPLEPTI